MDAEDYLLKKFRRCRILDSVERLCDKFDQKLSDDTERFEMNCAADHRRAEIAVEKNFDMGEIPKAVWAYVK